MTALANPYLLLGAIALGAIGVCLALPRPRVSPQQIGAVIAGLGLGLALLAFGLRAGAARPPVYFYIFSLIGLGAALRMITHPRPVYAALYFILTILSSAGLYLLLSAEFMAFALVIIYAGAILITYLFVIMLATEAPSEETLDALADYDKTAREPIASTIAGFLLLAALTGLFARGVQTLPPPPANPEERQNAALLAQLPGTWEEIKAALVAAEGIPGDAVVTRVDADGAALVGFPSGWGGNERHQFVRALEPGGSMEFPIPAGVTANNIQGVGLALVGEHPLGLELAGVVLLMAMVGAVVLARKQIQIDEGLKVAHAMEVKGRLAESMTPTTVQEQITGGAAW